MAKGTSSNSGRRPDPNSLRQQRPGLSAEWRRLPKSGREGPAPTWPLGLMSPREEELWLEWWTKPQAIMWELNDQTHEVALTVRAFTEAEDFRASVSSRTLVKQLMEGLGLTAPGLRGNRWVIVDDTAADTAPTPPPARRARKGPSTVKDRLRLVDGPGGDE